MTYLISIATLVCIYIILSVSLSFLIGHLGIFSMAHAALFGIGAYTYAILTVSYGWSLIPAILVTVLLAVLAGVLMAVPTLRIRGEYFLVASYALQLVASSVFSNWTPVTGGTGGIPGITRPAIAGLNLYNNTTFLVLVAIITAIIVAISAWIVHSPYGRMMHVVRDDELVAMTLGKPIASTKVIVTGLAAAFAGIAGVLYAQYIFFISPESFEVAVSLTIITMVVVGGMTSIKGSIVGAVIILLIPELLRQLDISPSVAGPLVQVFFGLLIVTLMFLRPEGLLGKRWQTPGRRRRRATVEEPTEEVANA